jgi:endonuclease/exonuclease/phosphatase family metal-dependent hydrolase
MRFFSSIWVALLIVGAARGETRFTVATFNLENYHLRDFGNRKAKPPEARAKVVAHLATIKPDVVALQEIGEPAALAELQSSLKAAGVDLRYSEHLAGWDTNIFVAVLSRFPITARHPHTNDQFLLGGRRFHSSRATIEVEIAAAAHRRFTLLTTHLKSKRQLPGADESELREQEALRLRAHIDALLARDPKQDVVVCGDLNDTKDAPAVRIVRGKGATALVDTRPFERNGDTVPSDNPRFDPRRVAWTHFYGKEDTYSRIDYILLSRGMARSWRPEGSYVFAAPDWGLASDHRPVVCEFVVPDK